MTNFCFNIHNGMWVLYYDLLGENAKMPFELT